MKPQKLTGKEALKIYKEHVNPNDDALSKNIDYVEIKEIANSPGLFVIWVAYKDDQKMAS